MKINQLKAGVILSYFSMVIGYIITLFYTPLMLDLLGKTEYGLYMLVSSIVGYLYLLNFGFNSAYLRFYSRFKVQNDEINVSKVNGMFLLIFSMLSILCLIAGGVIYYFSAEILGKNITVENLKIAKMLILIMTINLVFTFLGSVFNFYIIANEKYLFSKILYLIVTILNPLLSVYVLYLGKASIGMSLVLVSTNLFTIICSCVYSLKKLNMKIRIDNLDFSLFKEMTLFSSYIFINMIVDQINWNVDKIMLARITSVSSVAIYSLASMLNSYYMTLSSNISTVFAPRVNKIIALSDKDVRIEQLFNKVGRLQFLLLGLLCSGFVIYGKLFIEFWLGNGYEDVYLITLLLIIPVTIPLIQNLGLTIQRARNMHQFRSWVYLLMAIINVLLSIPLIQKFGPLGAAMGTSVSLILGNGIAMNYYYHFKMELNIFKFWFEIIKIIPSFIIPICIISYINNHLDLYNLKNYLSSIGIYSILYIVSIWLFAMNDSEKSLVIRPMMSLKLKVLRKTKM